MNRRALLLKATAVAVIALILPVGCTANPKDTGPVIPNILATETIEGIQAKALLLEYSWDDDNSASARSTAPVWQREFGEENTLVLDGEQGQNSIALSA